VPVAESGVRRPNRLHASDGRRRFITVMQYTGAAGVSAQWNSGLTDFGLWNYPTK